MSEKQKKLLKIFGIALAAGILTLVVWAVSKNWGAAYRDIPESTASQWKEPENAEVKAKVDEIAGRILSGKEYGFDELLYVMDHDSETSKKVLDYLVEQGKDLQAASAGSASE